MDALARFLTRRLLYNMLDKTLGFHIVLLCFGEICFIFIVIFLKKQKNFEFIVLFHKRYCQTDNSFNAFLECLYLRSTSSPAHFFAVRRRRKKGPGTLQIRD